MVDAGSMTATHVVVEPEGATVTTGETDTSGGEVPGDGTGEPTGGADPAAGQPGAGPTTNPAVKPAIATKTTTATSSSLPKTADSHWIAISPVLFLLGMALLSAAHRC